LFVFEGNGIVKDYLGSLSDYAECLVEQEKTFDTDTGSSSSADSVDSETKKILHKEDREKRNQRRNAIKKMKRELSKIEPAIEKLKTKAKEIQAKIDDSSDEGWTVLAELTEKVQALNEEVEEKEMEWLEIADELETLEREEEGATS
jgi:ATP-binding cassette subfamily F protein uup